MNISSSKKLLLIIKRLKVLITKSVKTSRTTFHSNNRVNSLFIRSKTMLQSSIMN